MYLGIEISENFRAFRARAKPGLAFQDECDTAAMTLWQQCASSIPMLRFFKLSHSLRRGSPYAESEADEEVDRIEEEELKPFKDYDHPASAGSQWELVKSGRVGAALQQVRLWRITGERDQRCARRVAARHRHRLQRCLELCIDGRDPLDGAYLIMFSTPR